MPSQCYWRYQRRPSLRGVTPQSLLRKTEEGLGIALEIAENRRPLFLDQPDLTDSAVVVLTDGQLNRCHTRLDELIHMQAASTEKTIS